MGKALEKALAGKMAMRRKLAALPFSEKMKMIEQMRDRGIELAANPLRRGPIPRLAQIYIDTLPRFKHLRKSAKASPRVRSAGK
jgi:hypothetical protein